MIHLMTERTFVLAVGVVPGTFELMVIIFHALCAVFHRSRVIAWLAINSPFHESVGVFQMDMELFLSERSVL